MNSKLSSSKNCRINLFFPAYLLERHKYYLFVENIPLLETRIEKIYQTYPLAEALLSVLV